MSRHVTNTYATRLYGRGWTKVMTTPLVLPPLEEEICGAKANIYYFDWLKCLTALPRVFMTFVNPLLYDNGVVCA